MTSGRETDDAQVAAVEHGLHLDRLAWLRQQGISFSEIGEVVIPPRTAKHRRSRRQPLSAQDSDRLLRVARVLAHAEHLFGDRERALRWLRESDDRLGNRTRLSLLKTESDGHLVQGLLVQLAEGIYS